MSYDPSKTIQMCWFCAQEMLKSYGAQFFAGNHDAFEINLK